MSEQIQIEILNWSKYNDPRHDVKSPSWFRLENETWISESLFSLSAEEKWVWICLLCHASKKRSGKLKLNVKWFADLAKVSVQVIESTIQKLVTAENLTCTAENLPLQTDRQTDRQTDKQTAKTKKPPQAAEFDLNLIYSKYPRKVGKTPGLKKLTRQIKTIEDYHLLTKAVENYAIHCSTLRTEPQFIKHFSTWVSEWRDWSVLQPASSPMKLVFTYKD